jgi:hypothetical protein
MQDLGGFAGWCRERMDKDKDKDKMVCVCVLKVMGQESNDVDV